ncbi:MAG: nitroreductase family protein [Desulfosalsimonadaceae bacterium]
MQPCLISALDRLIHERRSIRKYKPDLPSEEWILSMVRCAQMAPSPSNSQPVRFFRIASAQIRNQLNQAIETGHDWFLKQHQNLGAGKRIRNWINAYFRYSDFMLHAPVLFAVGTQNPLSGFAHQMIDAGIMKQDFRHDTDMNLSVGLSLSHFLLKAQELGLGACILTAPLVFIHQADQKKPVEHILNIEDAVIKCFITVGFADEKPAQCSKDAVEKFYRVI